MRKEMLIERYKISDRAARELKALRLTVGDMAVILSLGEKIKVGDMTSYRFGQSGLLSGRERKLRRLLGVEVFIVRQRIEHICHSCVPQVGVLKRGQR